MTRSEKNIFIARCRLRRCRAIFLQDICLYFVTLLLVTGNIWTESFYKHKDEIVKAIQEKKGKNIVSLDLRKTEGAICSYFVVCNADSTTQVGAIAAGVEEKVLTELNQNVWRVDGAANSLWIAMDYIDIVVHIFQTPLRDFYKLEQLWADAPVVKYESEE